MTDELAQIQVGFWEGGVEDFPLTTCHYFEKHVKHAIDWTRRNTHDDLSKSKAHVKNKE